MQKRPLRFWQRTTLFIVVLFVCVAILEGGSYFFLRFTGKLPEVSFREVYNQIEFPPTEADAKGRIPHPYFGHTYPESTSFTNNFGFIEEVDFPYKRRANEFVIGILGGSVAAEFARFLKIHPILQSQLVGAVPKLKDKSVRVLNLALHGGKQPQQFYIASYFGEMLDLIINLEGFNEAAWLNVPYYPLEYPQDYAVLFKTPDRIVMGQIAKLVSTTEIIRSIGRLYLLDRSSTYYLIWHSVHERVQADLYNLAKAVSESSKGGRTPEEVEGLNTQAKIDRLVAIWTKFVNLERVVANFYSIPMFVFLQPNQYVEGAKPLTKIEKEMFINPSELKYDLGRGRSIGYFQNAIADMKKSGVRAYDLTQVFAATRETVYIDNCCHVNDLGNEILARAIAKEVAQNLIQIGN